MSELILALSKGDDPCAAMTAHDWSGISLEAICRAYLHRANSLVSNAAVGDHGEPDREKATEMKVLVVSAAKLATTGFESKAREELISKVGEYGVQISLARLEAKTAAATQG